VSAVARLAPLAKSGVKAVAAAADPLVARRQGITILIYHRVGAGAGGEMDLDPTVFDEQLAWLTAHHRVLPLDQAADELAQRAAIEPGVVLTFDDGTRDWVDHALPALERHRVPATFYVSTDFVERQVPFPSDGRPIEWSALRELASSPLVTIGSHTHRHLLLDRLPADQVGEELDRSIELLADRAGVHADHFCYPKAVAGSVEADAQVRRRFRTAVLAGTRTNRAGADLHRLHRTPVQRSDSMPWFRRKAVGGMRVEDDLRRTVNRLRYRGKVS
jgi:peptidoglycan/xylan/chitin deacetylase (PgdA/CDA1 family)